MIHLGDITKIDGKRIEPVDVIVGGSPCQDLSVAGKRAGLAGERSGLFMEQIRLTKELRKQDAERGKPAHLCRPRYFVWENVPGAFSSKKGEDFAAVLEEVIRIIEPQAPSVSVPEKGWPTAGCIYDDMGRWSVAWRVHDAQFWGVPQRRRRIALVADFGGLSAPEVLFERKGLRGDPAQSGTPRQGAAADAERSSGGAIRTYNIGSYHSNAWKSDNPHSGVYETEVSKTLDALNCGYPACNQGGTAVVCARCFNQLSQSGIYKEDETSVSLTVCGGTYGGGSECLAVYDARGNGDGETVCTITGDHENRVMDYTNIVVKPMLDSGKKIAGCLMASGYEKLGAQEMFSGDYTVIEPIVYDGANITSSVNASNPKPGDPSHTLSTDSRNILVEPVYCLQGNGIDRSDTAGCNGKGWREDVSYTLNTVDRPAVYDARGNGDGDTVSTITGDHENRVTDYTALLTMQGFGDYKETGVTSACKSRDYKDSTDLVVSGIDARNGEEVYAIDHAITTGGNCTAQGPCVYKNIEATLKSSGVHAVSYESVDGTNCIKKHVRRLTPLECERLQGYPDGWTDIGEWVDSKGKRHDSSDSARYKALGNSIALPFWHWLMRRISAQYVGTPTLGSLFDGIGGFPLCWERINGKGTALWASEIEEFPIAVTKYHFGG